jgi:integrase
MNLKFSVRSIEGLKLPEGVDDCFWWDVTRKGFGHRWRRKSGKRPWVFQHKKWPRHILGYYPAMSLPAAQKEFDRCHALAMQGINPAMEKRKRKKQDGETFASCMEIYLEKRRPPNDPKLGQESYREVERHLTRNLHALHRLPMTAVTLPVIAIELDRISIKYKRQSNATHSSLNKFLKWCVSRGFLESNPAALIERNPEVARDRVLSVEELKAIWLALPEGTDYADIVRLLMLLGLRASECSDLRFSEIDTERWIITLPPSRTKNKREHKITLPQPAIAILQVRPRIEGRDFVFGSSQRGFSGWSKAKTKLDAQVKLTKPWVTHDLRRSCATHMGELGINPWVIEQCLNHISGTRAGVAGIYNRSKLEADKAIAWAQWADHLIAAIENRQSNIKPLKRA